MDVVLANKRPLSGSRAESEALDGGRRARGRRLLLRGDRRRRAADLRHLPQAGRIGRSRAQDRGLPLGHARLRADRGRERPAVLRGPAPGDGARLHRARPARRSVGRRRRPQGADPRPPAGLRRRAGRRRRRVAGPRALAALPREDFLARLADIDADWSRAPAAAKAKGGTLRYVASVTKDKISVGLRSVDRSSPFFGLKGTDNQVAFTTARYSRTRWSSPAPAPAPPSPRPACSTTSWPSWPARELCPASPPSLPGGPSGTSARASTSSASPSAGRRRGARGVRYGPHPPARSRSPRPAPTRTVTRRLSRRRGGHCDGRLSIRHGRGLALRGPKGLPLSGGQGGSAASAVAGAVANECLLGRPLDLHALLDACLEAEETVAGRHLGQRRPLAARGRGTDPLDPRRPRATPVARGLLVVLVPPTR